MAEESHKTCNKCGVSADALWPMPEGTEVIWVCQACKAAMVGDDYELADPEQTRWSSFGGFFWDEW